MTDFSVDDLLAELVRALAPTGTSPEQREVLYRRSQALVRSSIGRDSSSVAESRAGLLDKAARDVAGALQRADHSSSRALAISELVMRLSHVSEGVLRDPGSILRFFNVLASLREYGTVPKKGRDMVLDIREAELEDAVFRKATKEWNRGLSSATEDNSDEVAVVHPEKKRNVQTGMSSSAIATTVPRAKVSRWGKEEESEEQKAERLLLTDVVYALQGVDTASITLEEPSSKNWRNGDCVHIADEAVAHVSVAARNIAKNLAMAGALYRAVTLYVREVRSSAASGTCGVSLLSFAVAVERQLQEYLRLVAVVDTQRHLPSDSDHALTFFRLNVWLQEPVCRLKYVYSLVDDVRRSSVVGGELVSLLINRACHGDAGLHAIGTSIAREVMEPLHSKIVSWLTSGEMPSDAHGELFFSAAKHVDDKDMWGYDTAIPGMQDDASASVHSKYTLNRRMIPRSMTPQLCEQILLVGKTVHFVRVNCGEPSWQFSDETRAVLEKQSCNIADIAPFCDAVTTANAEANKAVVELLRTKFALLKHVEVMRKALLLTQRDFCDALIENLSPFFSLSPTTLHAVLRRQVDLAIMASNLQFEPAQCLANISTNQASMEEKRHYGWDVFRLTYHVEKPLNTVLHDPSLEVYGRLFSRFLALNQARYELARLWKDHMIFMRKTSLFVKGGPLREQLNHVVLLRTEMLNFLNSLCLFISDDVVMPHWIAFVKAIDSDSYSSLDYVIQAHYKYVRSVERHCLIMDGVSGSGKVPIFASDTLTMVSTLNSLLIPFYSAGDDAEAEALLPEIHRQVIELTNGFHLLLDELKSELMELSSRVSNTYVKSLCLRLGFL